MLERARSRLRLEPASWLLPLSCVLGYLVALGAGEQSPGYPLAVAVRGHGALIVLAPIGAGCAAWKAGRLRRGGWSKRRWRRSAAWLAIGEVSSTVMVQVVAYLAIAIAVASRSSGRLSWQPSLVIVAVSVLMAWIVIGFAFGWFLRPELAMPSVVVGSYLAVVYPIAVEPLWLRHLTGIYLSCCSQDAVLASGAVRGPIVLSAGIVGAVLLVIGIRRPVAVVGAFLLVGLGVALSVHQVDRLGAEPTSWRSARVLLCRGSAPIVCTWPEQASYRGQIASVSRGAFHRWAAAGLQVPRRVAPRPIDDAVPTIVAQVGMDPTDEEIRAALALGAIPEPVCTSAPSALHDAVEVARHHLALVGGVPPEDIAAVYGPAVVARARALLGRPEAERIAWLRAVEGATQACGRAVPDLPG